MTRPGVILDTETGGLDPAVHALWEVATIVAGEDGKPAEHLYRMEPDLSAAEPRALEVNRYYERTAGMEHDRQRPNGIHDLASMHDPAAGYWTSPKALAPALAFWLSGVTIVAANPTFDAGFLSTFLRSHGCAPAWHYRLRDIGSMAYGYLKARQAAGDLYPLCDEPPPMDASTDDFAVALGIDPSQFERHSALGDCRLVAAMLDVIGGAA